MFACCNLQAEGVKSKSELKVTGAMGVNYLEFFYLSTAGMIFSAVHWESSLKTKEARVSAADFLDRLVYKTMGPVSIQ